MMANRDTARLCQILRLLIEALETSCNRSARERHLVSGLARMIGATTTSVVIDAEPPSERARKHTAAVLVGSGCHSPRSLDMQKHEARFVAPIIRAIARLTPLEPGAPVTATLGELVIERCCVGPEYEELNSQIDHLGHIMFSAVRLRARPQIHGLGLYREPQAPQFNDHDRNVVQVFHTACEGVLTTSAGYQVDSDIGAALSRRERETLDLVLCGLADKEIAERLGISRHTVNQYTKAIYRHYSVTSRAQLLACVLAGPAAVDTLPNNRELTSCLLRTRM